MRRFALMLAGGLAGLSAGGSADAARPPARMLVYAQEWSLYPSRPSVPAGRVLVQLWNRGEDAHDLRIRRLDRHGHMVGRAQGVRVTQSGQLRQGSWRLKPGHYELYCSMPGHLKLGMHSRLLVR
jgi:hypothetical protein